MAATKLEKLLIGEVSCVDDPANEIPGWLVAKRREAAEKASKFKTGRKIGPDETWDVSAAEKRIRTATGATEAPNPSYASCFLWYDGEASDEDGDGVPDSYGDYKFLVCDEVDGEVQIMPAALRAAASRLPGSSIPDADKTSVGNTLDKLKSKAGIGDAATKATAEAIEANATSLLGMIRGWLQKGGPGKDDLDMDKAELESILAERDGALIEKVAETVAKAVGTPAEGAGAGSATETEAEKASREKREADEAEATAKAAAEKAKEEAGAESLTADDVTKAVEAAFQPVLEILDKTLDRVERVETALGIAARKSIDGQENGAEGDGKSTPTLKDAIGAALTGRSVTLK